MEKRIKIKDGRIGLTYFKRELIFVLYKPYFCNLKTVSVCCDKFEENHSNVERNGTN